MKRCILLITMACFQMVASAQTLPPETVIYGDNIKLIILGTYNPEGTNVAIATNNPDTDAFLVTVKFSDYGVIRRFQTSAVRIKTTPWTWVFCGVNRNAVISVSIEELKTFSSTEIVAPVKQ